MDRDEERHSIEQLLKSLPSLVEDATANELCGKINAINIREAAASSQDAMDDGAAAVTYRANAASASSYAKAAVTSYADAAPMTSNANEEATSNADVAATTSNADAAVTANMDAATVTSIAFLLPSDMMEALSCDDILDASDLISSKVLSNDCTSLPAPPLSHVGGSDPNDDPDVNGGKLKDSLRNGTNPNYFICTDNASNTINKSTDVHAHNYCNKSNNSIKISFSKESKGIRIKGNKVEDIPAYASINVQRMVQNGSTNSPSPNRVTKESMTRQEQISRQANQIAMQQQQQQQQRESQLSQQQQDRPHTRNDKTQTAADEKKLEPTDSEVQGGPVLDLNRHGKRLGISLLLCHLIISAKMIAAIYVCSTIDSSKFRWPWMPTCVFGLNGTGLVLEFFVILQGIVLICLKLQDLGPIASMLWHRLLAGCLAFATTIQISLIFILIMLSTVFEVLIYIELKNVPFPKNKRV